MKNKIKKIINKNLSTKYKGASFVEVLVFMVIVVGIFTLIYMQIKGLLPGFLQNVFANMNKIFTL